jgi:hypothetical protein
MQRNLSFLNRVFRIEMQKTAAKQRLFYIHLVTYNSKRTIFFDNCHNYSEGN